MFDKKVEDMITEELHHKQKLIDKVSLEIAKLAEKHYSTQLAALESIPGVGRKTAIKLLVISGGFSRFTNYRKLRA